MPLGPVQVKDMLTPSLLSMSSSQTRSAYVEVMKTGASGGSVRTVTFTEKFIEWIDQIKNATDIYNQTVHFKGNCLYCMDGDSNDKPTAIQSRSVARSQCWTTLSIRTGSLNASAPDVNSTDNNQHLHLVKYVQQPYSFQCTMNVKGTAKAVYACICYTQPLGCRCDVLPLLGPFQGKGIFGLNRFFFKPDISRA